MKAMAFTAHGGSDVIEEVDVELPEIKPFEVKIDTKAFALNYLDIWVRKGRPNSTMQFPHVSGSDFAGAVSEIGNKVKGFETGDRVIVNPGVSCMMCKYCRAGEQSQCEKFFILGAGSWGGSAEKAIVPANNLMKIPETMNYTDAAAAPLTTITVYRMIRTKANLLEGENLLVLGAGGGIGTVAIKMGKHFGANVIALTSTDKVERVRNIGADYVLDYKNNHEWDKLVLDYTNGEGVNVVIDPVGASTWEKSINSLANGGRHIVCGATTGPNGNTAIRVLFSKQAKMEGSYMGNNREFVQSMSLVKSGDISPVIDSVVPMADMAKSHDRLESGKHFGKLVLTI